MTDTDIIQALREKLHLEGGRHLYGVLGSYHGLESFAKKLQQAKDTSGNKFPKPLHVNRGILDSIPDDEFKSLVEDEARVPEPVRAHVARAFERFLRKNLEASGVLVLNGLGAAFFLPGRIDSLADHCRRRLPCHLAFARQARSRQDHYVP